MAAATIIKSKELLVSSETILQLPETVGITIQNFIGNDWE